MENQQAENQQAQPQAGAGKAVLSAGRGGIIGVKAGMTQVYTENGDALAVTVIDLQPNVVTQVKTKANEGYSAVQIGIIEKKSKRTPKAELGHAKKSGGKAFSHLQEFRVADDKALSGLTVGQTLSAEFIKAGDLVDVTSVSKGKGFQGVMKRHRYSGGYKSHGASVSHRQIGSIGNRADPGKVFKGKPMAGQMGNVQVTVQNVRVVKVDEENGYILLNGSVPGPKTSIVTIQRPAKAVQGKKAE